MTFGTVVVEANLTSGALITAGMAWITGVGLAVPGRVILRAAKGCHDLIKKGAKLCEGVEDILSEFEYMFPASNRASIAEVMRPAAAAASSAIEDGCWRDMLFKFAQDVLHPSHSLAPFFDQVRDTLCCAENPPGPAPQRLTPVIHRHARRDQRAAGQVGLHHHVPKVIPATRRLRMGKLCLSALRLNGNWVISAPCSAMRANSSPFSAGNTKMIPVQHRDGPSLRAHAPWCDAVSIPRAPPLTTVTPV